MYLAGGTNIRVIRDLFYGERVIDFLRNCEKDEQRSIKNQYSF